MCVCNLCSGFESSKRTKFINTLEVSHLKDLKMYFSYYDNKEHSLNKNDFVAAICSVTGKYSGSYIICIAVRHCYKVNIRFWNLKLKFQQNQ